MVTLEIRLSDKAFDKLAELKEHAELDSLTFNEYATQLLSRLINNSYKVLNS